MKRLIAMLVLALLAAGPAAACSSDADCPSGVRCMKPQGLQQGVCKGGGRQPAQGQQQPQRQQPQAAACTSDSDCARSQQCVQRGDGSAVCMPRRD
jgi:hypothetical protein